MERRTIADIRPFARDYIPETDIRAYNEKNTSKNADLQRRINDAKERIANKQCQEDLWS